MYKVFWAIVSPLRNIYWFIVRPKTLGVKCLIENDNSFLLVRLNYSHRLWSVPGGGVKKNETPEQATFREISEEVDILPDQIQKIGEYTSTLEHKNDTVHVFHYRAKSKEFKIDGFEIAEAAWFKLDSLPVNRTPNVDKIIKMHPSD